MKQTFGTGFIRDEMFGTVEEDVTLAGYDKHRLAEEAPAPLTAEEVEKAEIKKAETGVEVGASTKHTIATGVNFPVAEDALAALKSLKDGGVTYVQLVRARRMHLFCGTSLRPFLALAEALASSLFSAHAPSRPTHWPGFNPSAVALFLLLRPAVPRHRGGGD